MYVKVDIYREICHAHDHIYALSLDRLEAINDALYGGCSRIRLTDLFDHDFQLAKNMNVSYSTRYDVRKRMMAIIMVMMMMIKRMMLMMMLIMMMMMMSMMATMIMIVIIMFVDGDIEQVGKDDYNDTSEGNGN